MVMFESRFQSTRPRGARRNFSALRSFLIYFNPRAREGRDRLERHASDRDEISIHAPARGATPSDSPKVLRHVFQSTRPRGARR